MTKQQVWALSAEDIRAVVRDGKMETTSKGFKAIALTAPDERGEQYVCWLDDGVPSYEMVRATK